MVEYQGQIIDERDLAVLAKDGDKEAFEALVAHFTPRLKSFLSPRVGSRSEIDDIVQETFLKVYINFASYDQDYKFSCWLFTIASRTAINLSRAKKPQNIELEYIESFEANTPAPHDAITKEEEKETLWQMAQTLEAKQYSAIFLRYAQDLSVKEIAEVLETSAMNVRVLLHRGRKNLLAKMKTEKRKQRKG